MNRSIRALSGLVAATIVAALLAACATPGGPSGATPRATATLTATAVAGGSATAGSGTVGPAITVTPVPPDGTPAPTASPAPTATATATPPPTPTPPATAGPGAYGLLTVGPVCPVVRADQPCPDHAYPGVLSFQDAAGHEVARATAGDDGQYVIALAPGTYHVVPMSADGSMLPRAAPTDTTVASGAWTRLDVSYDSGIR